MKKGISIIALFGLLCVLFFTSCQQHTKGQELKIFNWGEFMSDGTGGMLDVVEAFEKETGIHVTAYDTYDSNEQMYAKIKSGTADYDLIFPSDYMVSRLIKEDLLAPIEKEALENYHYIMEPYKGSSRGYDLEDRYSVPYAWGTVGIVYNQKIVAEKTGEDPMQVVTGWDAFWDERFAHSMYMFLNSRDSFAIAEKRLGYSLNEAQDFALENAADLLKKQKPLVQAYVMDEMFDKMENGEAAIAPAYAGDIVTMMSANSDLRYCFPKEGSNLFVDCAAILKDAKNKENALKFIDFINRPEIAKENMNFICYSTPNSGAYNLMDEETKQNAIAYPPDDILKKCETYVDLPADAIKHMEDLWMQVRK